MPRASSDAPVLFDASGDPTYRKIFPAPGPMVRRGRIDVAIIGVAKSGRGVERLRERLHESLSAHREVVDRRAAAESDA